MKKITIPILSGLLVLCLTACGSMEQQPLPEGEEISLSESSDMDESAEYADGKEKDSAITTEYENGDIILSDGTVVKPADFKIADDGSLPIAVIAGLKDDGTALGVGVHRSAGPLQWAADDSAGYAAGFTDIVCTQESDWEFLGDKDGSDNWDVICAQDTEDTADAAKNYPAFHFVNTYAEAYGLTDDYAFGWYMPSIAELCVIYQNREAINESLQKIYELDNDAAMDGLGTNWYWSSSQAGAEDDYAWFVHYFNGYAGECPKNFTNVHVLAVRAF